MNTNIKIFIMLYIYIMNSGSWQELFDPNDQTIKKESIGIKEINKKNVH